MTSYEMDVVPTEETFDENGYLAANQDVAHAVSLGRFSSGYQHFLDFGQAEKRRQRSIKAIQGAKKAKFNRIRPLLRDDMPMVELDDCLDFLTPELRKIFNIIDTVNVSSNGYDNYALDAVYRNKEGLVLDCGAGRRNVYFDNVINFEIAAYDTTDVRGVGEVLPFKDASFDAVLSIAVLEHVKDPFQCAREISRVLKPGGDLVCCVPLLQPVHGYPHHYYNMTAQGLANLFAPHIKASYHGVPESVLPIWAVNWMLNSWAHGLKGAARSEFENLRVSDLMGDPNRYIKRPFVRNLTAVKNAELASATMLVGKKIG